MIPAPCASRDAQMLVSAALSTGRRAPATLPLHAATSCYLLMPSLANQTPNNKHLCATTAFSQLSASFLFLSLLEATFPTACGVCYHGDQLGSAEPECNFQGIPRNLGWCKGPGVTGASRGCHRRTPGVTGASRGVTGVTGASRGVTAALPV